MLVSCDCVYDTTSLISFIQKEKAQKRFSVKPRYVSIPSHTVSVKAVRWKAKVRRWISVFVHGQEGGKMPELTNDNLSMIVCCHKECVLPTMTCLLPVRGGSLIADGEIQMQRDDRLGSDVCDNISAKNGSFCELTAIYWAWKNLRTMRPNTHYVGVNHYRRYFYTGESRNVPNVVVKSERQVDDYVINIDVFADALKKSDVIISRKEHTKNSLYHRYCQYHMSDDIRMLVCVLHELHPEFDQAVCDVLFRSNAFSPYNMFVMQWSWFDEYCAWLFEVLFELERRIDISAYNRLQRRIYGYMGERLLNVWLHWKQARKHELPVVFFGDTVQANPLKERILNAEFDARFRMVRDTKKSAQGLHGFIVRDWPSLID